MNVLKIISLVVAIIAFIYVVWGVSYLIIHTKDDPKNFSKKEWKKQIKKEKRIAWSGIYVGTLAILLKFIFEALSY